MELDKRLIQLRIDVIEMNLKEIEQISKQKKLEYRDELALKHALLESIEACIDIANHIISVGGFRRPVDYKDIFRILVEEKVIHKSLGKRLEEMCGFRNVLVHRYAYVDIRKLIRFAKKDIEDIKEFVKVVLTLLKHE